MILPTLIYLYLIKSSSGSKKSKIKVTLFNSRSLKLNCQFFSLSGSHEINFEP